MLINNDVKKPVLFLLFVLISACSGLAQELQTTETALPRLSFSNAIADEVVMGKWVRSCALCHVTGVAGAPVVGDTEEWKLRLAQGEESILRHTIEGYNSMPPLGYCMACEIDDFRAMIGYMAGTNQ